MYGPGWAILLMYESHDMRHIGFHRLTVVNGTPGIWGVIFLLSYVSTKIIKRRYDKD